jgi:hypothetical protein
VGRRLPLRLPQPRAPVGGRIKKRLLDVVDDPT